MGTSLTGLTPSTTYDALIKVGDNGPLSATAKYLSDGLGNDSPLSMSTTLVGIGTSTPQADSKLHVVRASSGITARTDLGGVIIAEGSTRSGLYILTAGTDANSYGSIWWGNGNVNTDASIKVNNSTRAMIFSLQDDTERMRITAGGNVGIGTTTPTQKLDVAGRITAAGNDYHALSVDQGSAQLRLERTGTSTGVNYIGADNAGLKIFNSSFGVLATFTANGLTFNGDTAAANALDDYEEGTWTPVYRQNGVNNTATYVGLSGTYTKIGNLVTAFFDIDATSITAGVGGCELAGLPFTISNTMAGFSYVPFRDPSALATILTNAIGIGFAQKGSDYIAVRQLSTITGQESPVTSWFTSGRLTGVLQYTV
jgi:hypothetical protein